MLSKALGKSANCGSPRILKRDPCPVVELGKMEGGRAFQILAERIRNEDAKRFVRDHVGMQILTVPIISTH
ncbi:jg23816 [Pararge aegeria aegeria]|uniref:Jg23816 protein n=1 Tax=Pararge aegeria aegeria TaxID=348720 RepID=A0A8S4SJX0_9NEOP|nr:jg23816 [Pararge aegeria aegeria]